MTYTYNESGVAYNQSGITYDGETVGLANMPVVGVFVAFDDGPYVADPDWVEVTDYVRDLNIRRGRQDDLQQFPSGSCSITFDNRDRLFDPFNTSGTYYGKLKPRRQVRVIGQWAGVNYPLFRGFVAGWPVEFTEGGKDSTVTVDCFDALGLLATDTNTQDWLTEYTMSLNPTNYYKMNEGINTTRFENTANPNKYIEWFTSLNENQKLVPSTSSTSVYSPQFRSDSTPAPDFGVNVSVSFWMLFYYGTPAVYYSSNTPWILITNSTLDIVLEARISGNRYQQSISFTSAGIQDNQPAHIVVTFNVATNFFRLFVNGLEKTLGARITTVLAIPSTPEMLATDCAIQEWSTYKRLLTPAEALGLYLYGLGDVKELSSARVQRVMDKSLIPASLVSLQTGVATVTELVSNVTKSEMINQSVISENGEWFADASGVFQFVSRGGWASRARSNTSQASFTDTGTGVFYDADAVRMNVDADTVRNDVEVSFVNGGLVDSSSDSSINEVGAASESLRSILPDAVSAKALADYRVSIFKNPKLRVEPFLVKGQRNPSYDWPLLLNLELLDRFTFVRTPSVGSAIQKDMLLQSVEHRITPGTWETTINGSARYTGWFILGVSLLGSTEDVLL